VEQPLRIEKQEFKKIAELTQSLPFLSREGAG
jgi:hypothetical protein